MKRFTFTFVFAMALTLIIAQPSAFKYQTVVRDAGGIIIPNQSVAFRMSIVKDSVNGLAIYTEDHSASTNDFGLANIEIGNGVPILGTFDAIDWGAGNHYLEINLDPAGGNNFIPMGVSQLLSVPYSNHAKTAEIVTGNVATNVFPPLTIVENATDIELSSATLNGKVNAQGFSSTVVFEWGLTTIYDSTTTAIQSPVTGSDDISVSADLTGLQNATTYHYRIKATNAVNVTYSEDITFTTQNGIISLATADITNVTANSATSGGNITNDGGASVLQRGVCWSTGSNPTLDDNYTQDGAGSGTYTSEITGLNGNTHYYVRAYATNAFGTVYGNEFMFFAFMCGTLLSDVDGNTYNSVLVGNQCWMKENLKTTSYSNATLIPNVTDSTAWLNLTSGAYVWYDNDTNWKDAYGALYNWYATVNPNGLCPVGWHVPGHNELTALTAFIGGTSSPNGNKLKSCRQVNSPLGGDCNTTEHPRWNEHSTNYGTDDYGFSSLPGGFRSINGPFDNLGNFGHWWSTTEHSSTNGWGRTLGYSYGYVAVGNYNKLNGFSVRCIRD
ncbi:MAG: fibrobacter succinogenes major paralogous domain-containing protein [Bacteroidales bacterium]